ncbi:MAG: CYTH domain-containing protein [Clostridiales bacterium]|nr:CYTH domain-containing protein [Clostridiales bacterium]
MEIERKYLVEKLPEHLEKFKSIQIEQGYLCREPVVRIRRENEDYYLTYKSKGFLVREEYNLPLTKDSYKHLFKKVDGKVITKTRYIIPLDSDLNIELDVFLGDLEGLLLAEVEFLDEETANTFIPPKWFGEDVTFSEKYQNSNLSK